MKKKRILLLPMLLIGLLGCSPNTSNKDNSSLFPASETSKEEVSLLRVDGAILNEAKKEVLIYVNQDEVTVDLNDRVQCSGNATWKLAYDALGKKEIEEKIAEGEEEDFHVGENTFYIIVTSLDEKSVSAYTLRIFRIDDSLQLLEYENCLYYGNEENPYMVLVRAKKRTITEANVHPDTKFIMDNAFSGCDILTEVMIPNGVIAIRHWAFSSCSSLASITIPSSVTMIERYAFSECNQLSSIFLPRSVTNIGEDAFYDCNFLTIYCEASNKPKRWDSSWNSFNRPVYWGTAKEDVIKIGNLQYLIKDGSVIITKCDKDVENVVIAKEIEVGGKTYPVTSIGKMSFQECDMLESITFEEESALTSIGESAFENCISLKSIAIPQSVKEIKESAFYKCSSLSSVVLPKQIESIENGVFSSCRYLTSITIPSRVTTIKTGAFSGCSKLSEMIFEGESKLESIQRSAFSRCSSLSSIEIPSSVTTIEDRVFEDCSSLKSIEIPNSVVMLGEGVFEDCSSLTSVSLPNSISTINDDTFYGCSSLTSIEIPTSVNSIGNNVFRGCSSLTSVFIPLSVKRIGYDVFSYGIDFLTIYCEATSQPGGWDPRWNYYDYPVKWGWKKA